MPARCRIAGTTSTPRSRPAACRKKDALKESGTKPRKNSFFQIFSPGRTPVILRKPAGFCSLLSSFSLVNAFYLSVTCHARKKKEHHGTELYIQTDHRTDTGLHCSFGSLFNGMGTNAHAHADLHSPNCLHLFTHSSHRC